MPSRGVVGGHHHHRRHVFDGAPDLDIYPLSSYRDFVGAHHCGIYHCFSSSQESELRIDQFHYVCNHSHAPPVGLCHSPRYLDVDFCIRLARAGRGHGNPSLVVRGWAGHGGLSRGFCLSSGNRLCWLLGRRRRCGGGGGAGNGIVSVSGSAGGSGEKVSAGGSRRCWVMAWLE